MKHRLKVTTKVDDPYYYFDCRHCGLVFAIGKRFVSASIYSGWGYVLKTFEGRIPMECDRNPDNQRLHIP